MTGSQELHPAPGLVAQHGAVEIDPLAPVGFSLAVERLVIGKLLGHRKVTTTARYAHLARDTEKASAVKVGRSIGADIRRRFPLVLLDEAQDTNGGQLALLNRLFAADVAYQRLGDQMDPADESGDVLR